MKIELKYWIALIALACIWGSSFILMKLGMFDFDGNPVFNDRQVGAMRMLLAATALLPFALPAIRKVKSWKVWIALLGSGLCGNFFPAFLFTYAETGVSSGYAGMLNSFTPIFTLLIGIIFFQNKLSGAQWLGVFIGTLGIISLSTSGELTPNTGTYWHILAVILATLMYGISLNLIRYKLNHLKSVEITSLAFFTILAPSLFTTLYFKAPQTLLEHPHAWTSFSFIAILALVGTAFAVFLFSYVITQTSTLFASSVTYLIPIVAAIIGLFYHETITTPQILSMFVILSGIYIANTKSGRINAIFASKK